MNINHISVSRKKCFDTCSQQYKYRYHLKIPNPGPEQIHFVYGTIVHKIAELYVEKRGEMQIGEIAELVLRGKIPIKDDQLCPDLPAEYKRKLPKHLRAIQNLTERVKFDGVVEYPFEYDLDPPHGRKIVGFIDRLIIKGEKAFILDYKTTKKGKWRVNKDTVTEDLQLRMYARVVQRNFNLKPENIKAALFYMEGEELVAAQFSESSLSQVEDELRNAFIEIEQADADKVWGRVGWHCKFCDYNSMCPFYKGPDAAVSSWNGDMTELGHDNHWEV